MMLAGRRVEYETGWAEVSIGVVVAVDSAREVVTVIDEDDGTEWHGPMDRVTPIVTARD